MTHTDKSIPSSSEDEKLSLTHADLSSLLANLAWFSIARFETLDGLFGIHPLDRGQHLEQRRVSYTAWKRGSSTPELAPPTRLPNPDPRPHISRESARRTADQVFRYAGKSGLVINLDSDFAPTESITLSQLRGWFAGQSKALLSPLVSFFRDRFLSLLHLPFALTSALEALDAQSPTAVAQPPLLPVPDPTLPILIRPLRSRLLKPSHVPLLSSVVPGTKQPVWTLLYSGAQLGFSMRTFDDLIVARCHGPSLLLISGKPVRKETAGTPHSESIVVGAYLPKPWNSTGSPFGNEASRLFEVSPLFEVLPATLQSLDFARYAPSTFGFSFGGTHETARLRMDPEFRYARYAQLPVRQAAPSYAFSRARGGSQVREFSVGFEVLDVEVWGIEGKEIGELEAREASASLGVDKKTAIEAAAAEQEEEEAEIEIDVELMKVLDALPPKGPS